MLKYIYTCKKCLYSSNGFRNKLLNMENIKEIRKFNELLQQFFNKNTKVLETSSKLLTSAGDNYGSQMIAIEVKTQHNNSITELVNLVAKVAPPNEFLKVVFDIPFTFKKEIAVYTTIFPTLRQFQKQQGTSSAITFFPECYGTRLSLNPNADIADDDAVLLLENLKISGYQVDDRFKGFNLQTAELLLKDLAIFHAIPIALKLLEPEVFNCKILPNLKRTPIFDKLSDDGLQACIDFIVATVKPDHRCESLIDTIIKSMRMGFQHSTTDLLPPREPFATINHNDYWVNNTMIKFENNNAIKNKMIDFQIVDYGSPGNDIIFLLFSSVQMQVIKSHYENLIQLYYNTFRATLNDLKCNTAPFTFENLLEEIDICAKSTQFFHVMVMLRHVFAIKDKVKNISEITEEDLVAHSQVSEKCAEKVIETVLYFKKKRWI